MADEEIDSLLNDIDACLSIWGVQKAIDKWEADHPDAIPTEARHG